MISNRTPIHKVESFPFFLGVSPKYRHRNFIIVLLNLCIIGEVVLNSDNDRLILSLIKFGIVVNGRMDCMSQEE